MKKLVIPLVLALILTACSGKGDEVASNMTSNTSSATTSEVTSTSQENSEITSQSTFVVSELAPVEVQTYDGEIVYFYNEPMLRRSDLIKSSNHRDSFEVSFRKLGKYSLDINENKFDYNDLIVNKLLNNYFSLFQNYYIDGLLPFARQNGAYKIVGQDVYPMDWTYMTKYRKTDEEYEMQRYEGMCLYRYAYATFIESVAKEVLDNPTYNGKRYHYFEKDGETYIDQSVAKSQGYLPHDIYGENSTYKYNFYCYSFNYTVNNDKMDIVVYLDNDETGMFEQFTMEAVLENSEWRLAEFFDFEERVTVCDPQPVG